MGNVANLYYDVIAHDSACAYVHDARREHKNYFAHILAKLALCTTLFPPMEVRDLPYGE